MIVGRRQVETARQEDGLASMAGDRTVTVRRIATNVGAVVSGVDLRAPLAAETVRTIRQALLDHGVVFMRDQDISREQMWAFAEHFGQPQASDTAGSAEDRPEQVATLDFGPQRGATSIWHADMTSMATPPLATLLRAVQVPEFGGDTSWSSMAAAWDALSPPMQAMLDGLTALHVVESLVERLKDFGPQYRATYTRRNGVGSVHPVALTHPESGRRTLYVNEAFVTRIVELEPAESAAVLAMLFRHVQRPEFTMRWKWRANDVAFWDNRSVQHYASPDYVGPRLMQRFALAGWTPGKPSSLGGAADARSASRTDS